VPACPKSKPLRDRKFLDWLREQPCLVTNRYGNSETETVDPAHFRWGTDGGASMKPSDCYATPLIHSEHLKQHRGEVSYWLEVINEDPAILCRFMKDALKWRYYQKTGNVPT